MYYLEDHHAKYEYTCYIRAANATPYIGVWTGTSMDDVWRKIHEIEKKHGRYNQHFYIDNDFYKNVYQNGDYVYYYRFMKRSVNDWETIKTQENVIDFTSLSLINKAR